MQISEVRDIEDKHYEEGMSCARRMIGFTGSMVAFGCPGRKPPEP